MENIIEELIKIETAAQNSIKAAREQRESLAALIERKEKEIRQTINKETDKQIANLKAAEEKAVKSKLSQIETEKKQQLYNLNKTYKANKEKWIQIIFNSILGD